MSTKELEELEFVTIYRSIVDNLLSVCNCKNLKTKAESSRSEERDRNLQLARQQLTVKLRSGADYSSKEIRSRLLKHFIQEKESRALLQHSFLSVVLDESIEEVTVAFDHGVFDDHILPTIVERCPHVQVLHLHCLNLVCTIFFSNFSCTCSFLLLQFQSHVLQESLVKSFHQLACLSSISLHKVPVECCPIIFELGKSCPNLKILRVCLLNHILDHDVSTKLFQNLLVNTIVNKILNFLSCWNYLWIRKRLIPFKRSRRLLQRIPRERIICFMSRNNCWDPFVGRPGWWFYLGQ